MAMTREQKKEYAQVLYLKTNLTQKDIAARVGVTEKTLGKWIKEGDWEMLKSSLIITKEQELRRMYHQLNELNNDIATREQGKRYASSKEADILSKLAAAIKSLERDTSIADVIDVFIDFANWLKEADFEMAQQFINLQDDFVKHKLKTR
jgi:DNA-binding XRE family transcriptional regulator